MTLTDIKARVSRLVNLRVAFGLMTLATLLAGAAAVTSLRAQQESAATAGALAEVVARLDAEIEARDVQSCESAKVVRVEQQDLLEFFAELHRYYDGLPAPADCSP